MTDLLIRLFVKDYKNVKSEKVRYRFGVLSGTVGILLNFILSAFKMIFGAVTKSIAIIADGANNAFDAVSSIINLVGFKISVKPADDEHPFGHGRIEYVSALTLAFVIIVMAVELVKTSIEKFKNPGIVIFSLPAVAALIFSILAKIWLALFNRKVGGAINSVAVNAVVADCAGDVAATLCSLVALVCSKFTDFPVDAVMGVVVALIIASAGIGVVKSAISPLLGEPPDKEIVKKLKETVLSCEDIVGIHDLTLHSYGHSRIFGSLHAEVPAENDVIQSHDAIDLVEARVKKELGIELSIHLDPVINDERTNELKESVAETVGSVCSGATIHDFRIVDGPTHTNLIFDAVLPRKSGFSENEFKEAIDKALKEKNPRYFTVIKIDRDYVVS